MTATTVDNSVRKPTDLSATLAMTRQICHHGHMDNRDFNTVITDLRAHRARLIRDLARVDRALIALTNDDEEGPASTTPVADRVMELFEEHPQAVFTAESALETLIDQGWESDATDPMNAMRTALSRLARRGAIRRVGRGEYAAVKPVELTDPWAQSGRTVSNMSSDQDPWA